MRYILFVIHNLTKLASDDEMEKIGAFNKKLKDLGYWIAAEGIAHSSEALLIDNRDGIGQVEKGSVFDSPDFYNGFWLLEVPSKDVAKAIALEASEACNRRVELRPYL